MFSCAYCTVLLTIVFRFFLEFLLSRHNLRVKASYFCLLEMVIIYDMHSLASCFFILTRKLLSWTTAIQRTAFGKFSSLIYGTHQQLALFNSYHFISYRSTCHQSSPYNLWGTMIMVGPSLTLFYSFEKTKEIYSLELLSQAKPSLNWISSVALLSMQFIKYFIQTTYTKDSFRPITWHCFLA